MDRAGARIPALDGLRGVAIAWVMAYHFVGLAASGPVPDLVLHVLAAPGWAGVDLFFVLSGFLITGILLDTKGRARYFRTFYVRRALRILPVYFLLLAVLAAVAVAGGAAERGRDFLGFLPWLVAYGGNFAPLARGHWPGLGAAPLWSLAIEEQFYAVWPLVVLVSSRRGLLRLSIAIVGAAPLLRILVYLSGAGADVAYLATPCRADALAAGAFVAVALRECEPARLRRWAGRVALVLLAVCGAAFLGEPSVFNFGYPLTYTVGYSVLAGLFACAVLLAATGGRLAGVVSWTPLRRLGMVSYGVYLFHAPVMIAMQTAGLSPRAGALGHNLVVDAAAAGATILLASISWRCYERPFLALKSRFGYFRPPRLLRAEEGSRVATA